MDYFHVPQFIIRCRIYNILLGDTYIMWNSNNNNRFIINNINTLNIFAVMEIFLKSIQVHTAFKEERLN